jgi:hypothetical protein
MPLAGTRPVALPLLSPLSLLSPLPLLICLLLVGASGCQTNAWQQWNETIKGGGFTSWNESMSTGVRGKDTNAKPSGFFTDRRSEQIEQNLGGGF